MFLLVLYCKYCWRSHHILTILFFKFNTQFYGWSKVATHLVRDVKINKTGLNLVESLVRECKLWHWKHYLQQNAHTPIFCGKQSNMPGILAMHTIITSLAQCNTVTITLRLQLKLQLSWHWVLDIQQFSLIKQIPSFAENKPYL